MLLVFHFPFSLLIVISLIYYPVFVESSTGWLRFCENGETFRVSPHQCAAGVWLKQARYPQCVCANGVWILSKGYCDPKYAVIVGFQGTCFALNVETRWIRMVGAPDNPFAPYYFITNKNFDRIDAASASGNTRRILSPEIFAAAISPKRALQHVDGTTCVIPKKAYANVSDDSKNDIMENEIVEGLPEAFNVAIIDDEEKPWEFDQSDVCTPGAKEYAYGIALQFNHFYQNNEIVDGNQILHTCNQTCLLENELNDEQTSESRAKGQGQSLDEYPTSAESEYMTSAFRERPCLDWDPKWDAIPNKTQREIAEQTKRLALTQMNYAFFKHAAPEVKLTEYGLFQKSRKIMEKICPKSEVPPLFLRGVLRMFRHALNESHYTYPYLRQGDSKDNARILDSLNKCLMDPALQAMEFNYNTTICPSKFLSVSFTFNSPNSNKSKQSVNSYVRCVNKFNTTLVDYVVETAWKVVLFSHYLCARHFANNSYDHSRFLEKMSGFFNREIQHRWHHLGKSYEVMTYIFRTYDLEKIAFGIDRCVGTARSISQYRKWIDRPKFIQFCAQADIGNLENKVIPRIQNVTTWNGAALCLKDWKDPLSLVKGYKSEATRACAKEGMSNMLEL